MTERPVPGNGQSGAKPRAGVMRANTQLRCPPVRVYNAGRAAEIPFVSDIPRDVGTDSSPERPRGERLDSWKEIAAYLKRDVATVRRWERREALPIHRHLHEKLASVSAYTSELEAWAEGRRQPSDQVSPGSADRAQRCNPSHALAAPRALPWVALGALAFGTALFSAIRRCGPRCGRLPAAAPQRGSGRPAGALQRPVRGRCGALTRRHCCRVCRAAGRRTSATLCSSNSISSMPCR